MKLKEMMMLSCRGYILKVKMMNDVFQFPNTRRGIFADTKEMSDIKIQAKDLWIKILEKGPGLAAVLD